MTINSPSQQKENLFTPLNKQFLNHYSNQKVMDPPSSMARPPGSRMQNYSNMRKRRGRPPADPSTHEKRTSHSSLSHHGRNLDHMDENSLFGALRLGIASCSSIVDSWIERYKLSKDDAMLALIQFFISSSGCRGKVDISMIKSSNDGEIIKKMTEEFDEDVAEYPLMQSSPQWRRFKNNFIEFIQCLIKQCQYSIIYDGSMMEKLISFLTVLSDSQVRAFRHTATLAALKLMSALVDVALNLSINWDNNQRQYEVEKAKGITRKGNERYEFLQRRREELTENKDDVKNVLSFLFKSVFVHRYRDNQQEIRSICMQEIGVWMRRYPTVFLDDSYLKYIGWTLFDRVGEVRVQCLKALQPLYEDQSLVSALELFTSRFKSRLVDMTLDKDNDVAVQAVKLMICILKFNEAVLENKDCENIYELVYCTQRSLATAAGEFLHLKLFDEMKAAAAQEQEMSLMSPDKHKFNLKRKSPNIPLFRDLVQFFIESELHEHAAYLIDSLWDSSPMLRDWEAMLDLLLLDSSMENSDTPLDSNQESALIQILCCCVRQSVTGLSPVGRQTGHSHSNMPGAAGVIGAGSSFVNVGSNSTSNQIADFTARLPVCLSYGFTALGSGNVSSKELRILQEERFKMTNCMIPAMVNLLKKFAESHERITNLLQIPLFMDFDIYTSGRHERQLDLLLRTIQDIFRRHVNQDCLLAVSKIFAVICQDELSIATKCQTIRATMVDQLIEIYKSSFLNYFKDDGDMPTDDETYHLKISMKKLDAFYSVNDLSSSELWASLFKIITTAVDPSDSSNLSIGDKIDPEIICYAISICHYEILWRFQHLIDADIEQDEIKSLKEKLDDFIKQCHSMIKPEFYQNKSRKKISIEAYLSLCDLLVIFSRHLVSDSQPDPDVRPEMMHDLVVEPDLEISQNLVNFAEKIVFIDEEDYSKSRMTSEEIETASIENLHMKRTQLAAFCKLIIYNLVPIKISAPLYKHYIRSYSDFGDIMKSTLAKTREINRVHTARMIALCLQLGYEEIEQSNVQKKVERSSDGFQGLKELARRLTLSFGLDLIKIREAMVSLHTESIQFCVRSAAREASITGGMPGVPPNLLFLEIITEFSNKLLQQDKKSLSEYISRVFPNPIGEVWQSLHAYKASLDPESVDENQVGLHLSAISNARQGKSVDMDGSMASTMSSPKRRKLNYTSNTTLNQTTVAPVSESVQSTPLHSHNTRRMQQINEISGAV